MKMSKSNMLSILSVFMQFIDDFFVRLRKLLKNKKSCEINYQLHIYDVLPKSNALIS